jgi:hypothetical protein
MCVRDRKTDWALCYLQTAEVKQRAIALSVQTGVVCKWTAMIAVDQRSSATAGIMALRTVRKSVPQLHGLKSARRIDLQGLSPVSSAPQGVLRTSHSKQVRLDAASDSRSMAAFDDRRRQLRSSPDSEDDIDAASDSRSRVASARRRGMEREARTEFERVTTSTNSVRCGGVAIDPRMEMEMEAQEAAASIRPRRMEMKARLQSRLVAGSQGDMGSAAGSQISSPSWSPAAKTALTISILTAQVRACAAV